MARSQAGTTVIVIGAGVVGLSCALKLQSIIAEQSSSWQVVIASKEWPTSIPGVPQSHSVDYASMWAGAHVRPIPATSPQLRREAIRLKQTVAVFARMLKEDPSCGITQTRGVEYIDAPTDDYKGHSPETFEAQTGLPEFRELDLWELPDGVAFGFEYQTFCINSPVYCGNLLRKFVLKGGQTVQSDFKSEWEPFSLFDNVKLVVNASGTGFHDPRCFPTPGQIVLTTAEQAKETITRQHSDGSWSFIIPRFFNGGTIMGGTKEPGSWKTTPNKDTSQKLIDSGIELLRNSCPSGSAVPHPEEVHVIKDVVGRRPTREAGARIELEDRMLTDVEGSPRRGYVVHAYGAGGRGFEISWGIANEVGALARDILSTERETRPKL